MTLGCVQDLRMFVGLVLSWTLILCLFVEFLFIFFTSVIIDHLSGCLLWFFHVWKGTAVFYVKKLEGKRAFVGTFVNFAFKPITFHLWNQLKRSLNREATPHSAALMATPINSSFWGCNQRRSNWDTTRTHLSYLIWIVVFQIVFSCCFNYKYTNTKRRNGIISSCLCLK